MRTALLFVLALAGLSAQTLAMKPKEALVPCGETVQFQIPGQDSKSFKWRADRGKVDESGLFTAPREPGLCHVTAHEWQDVNRAVSAEVRAVEIHLVVGQEQFLRPKEESRILVQLKFRGGELDRKLIWDMGDRLDDVEEGERSPVPTPPHSEKHRHDGRVEATGWVRAPSVEGTYPVHITFAADPRILATTYLRVFPPRRGRVSPIGEPVTVKVQPDKAEIRAGTFQPFSVVVSGSDVQQVAWSVVEGPKDGELGSDGFFHPTITGTYRIRATSFLYPDCWGEAEVAVKPAVEGVKEGEAAKVNRLGMGIASGPKGGYFVVGGWDGTQAARDVFVHDAMGGTFEACTLMQAGRARSQLVRLSDGTALVVGGFGGQGNLPLRDAERVDAERKVSWRVGAPRWFHIGGLLHALPGGRALLVGGREPAGQPCGAEVFEPATSTFRTLDERPWPTHAASILLEGGMVLILGGELERRPLALVWRFDPAKDSFTPLGKLTQARSRFSATLSIDQKSVMAIGGRGAQGSLATAELFDLANGKAAPAGRLSAPREGHAAILIPTGMTLVFGGGDGARASRITEEWNPDSGAFSIQSELPSGAWLPSLFLNLDGGVFVSGIPGDILAKAPLPRVWRLWD